MDNKPHAGHLIASLTRAIPGSRSYVGVSAFEGMDKHTEGKAALAALISCALRDPEKVMAAAILGLVLNSTGEGGTDDIQEKVLTLLVTPDDWVTEGAAPISKVSELSNEDRVVLAVILAHKVSKVEALLEMRTQIAELADNVLEVGSALLAKYVLGGA